MDFRFVMLTYYVHIHTHTHRYKIHRDKVIAMSAPPYYVVGTDNYRKLINVVLLCISAYQRHSTSFETDVVFNVLRGFRPRRLFLSMRITLKLLIGVLSLPHSRVDRQCSLK